MKRSTEQLAKAKSLKMAQGENGWTITEALLA